MIRIQVQGMQPARVPRGGRHSWNGTGRDGTERTRALLLAGRRRRRVTARRTLCECSITIQALFSFQKILQNFSDSPSHQIFRRMHEVLNIDKNKN
jgi:hypothetical protein